jgi:hypothetical protein
MALARPKPLLQPVISTTDIWESPLARIARSGVGSRYDRRHPASCRRPVAFTARLLIQIAR